MVTQTITQVFDDIDGLPGAETVTFGLGSDTWTIDLSKENRVAFEGLLKPYIDAGRKAAGRRRRVATNGLQKTSRSANLSIRTWARTNGYAISDRGRVATSIVDAYNAAH